MDAIEKRARELLRSEYMLSLSGAGPKQRHLYECAIRAIVEALTPSDGHVVVTRNEAGQAVAVTRQDNEGRILSVIAEFEMPDDCVDREELLACMDRAFYDGMSKAQPQIPEGYVLVPVEPTEAMLAATAYDYRAGGIWTLMVAARPEVP